MPILDSLGGSHHVPSGLDSLVDHLYLVSQACTISKVNP